MKPLSEETRFILSLPAALREELIDLVEDFISLTNAGFVRDHIEDELDDRIAALEARVEEPEMIKHIVLGAALDSQGGSSVTINQ